MVKVLEGLAVGLTIVVDENTWFRWQAFLSHQVKFEPQVSERAKGLEEYQPPFRSRSNEEDLDGTGMRNAWHWSTPFIHIHTRGNNSNLTGRHSIALYKVELCPFRPRNEPTRGHEAGTVQAPFPSL
jgi:hypothetical protein